jgi:hypothetical protein
MMVRDQLFGGGKRVRGNCVPPFSFSTRKPLHSTPTVLRNYSGFFQASKTFEGSCNSEKPLKNR